MLLFHRTPGGRVNINYNGLSYSDSTENLETDSGGLYTDTLNSEFQRWDTGRTCVIENGNQGPAPEPFQTQVTAVLDNLQTIVDAQMDRIAFAIPEAVITLDPTSIAADGAASTTVTVQLVSGLKHDTSRESIAQSGVTVQIRVTNPGGIQVFEYLTDANGQVSDIYDAVQAGIYTFEVISHVSVNTPELLAI